VEVGVAGLPNVVLIHHAAGGASDWAEIAGLLDGRAAIVAPDLPGHGARVAEEPLASIEAMASFVAGLLDEEPGRPAVLVGHSMGGAVALQMAFDHPRRVGALLLISTGARLRVATALLDLVREHFPQLPQQMFAMGFSPAVDPSVANRWLPGPWPAGPAAALADFVACDRFDVRPRLPQVAVPTTVMVGEDDMMTPVRRARELADGVPGARLRILPRTGHLAVWERPGEVVDEILRLIEAASGAGEGR
jgi:pimeloyl-ACP methyl ester carboxylesterase